MRSTCIPLAMLCALLCGCPAPDPKTPPVRVETEEDAKHAFDAAKAKDDVDALLAVHARFGALPSGKEALRVAAQMLVDQSHGALAKCDETTARALVGRLGPLTLKDKQIDKLYDDMEAFVVTEHRRCALLSLDDDLDKAKEAWDWPKVFERIASEREVDGATVKTRRLDAIAQWKKLLDKTVREIVEKKSVSSVVGDKRQKLERAVNDLILPPELADELAVWTPAVRAALLLYGDMKDVQFFAAPRKLRVVKETKARLLATPMIEGGPTLAMNLFFDAIARGKYDGASFYVTGKAAKDPVERLASVKLMVPEANAK
jgi:hypothetical protein